MTLSRIFLGLFFLGILMAAVPAAALEGKMPVWRYNAHSSELPFPRSKRAEVRVGVRCLLATAAPIAPGGWQIA